MSAVDSKTRTTNTVTGAFPRPKPAIRSWQEPERMVTAVSFVLLAALAVLVAVAISSNGCTVTLHPSPVAIVSTPMASDKCTFDNPTIILVRHGRTHGNEGPGGGVIKGTRLDMPLDVHGRKEAGKDADTLSRYRIAYVEHSPMKRASQTAAIIAKATGGKLQMESGLAPLDAGYLTGHTRTSAHARMAWYITHPDRTIPEGESYAHWYAAFADEISEELAEAERSHRDGAGAHVLVTHSTGMLALPSVVAGDGPRGVAAHSEQDKILGTGRIATVTKRGGRWTVDYRPDL